MLDQRIAITIPPTSRQRYLGGMAALNLPTPDGTGDWHIEQTFFREREKRARSFISGEGCPTDTIRLLGDRGVHDCTQVVDSLHIPHESPIVWAASHARAIADLVLGAVMAGRSPAFVRLDDFMPRDTHKQQVFDLLDIATPKLTSDQQAAVLAWQKKNQI
jgi:hypothetical protein